MPWSCDQWFNSCSTHYISRWDSTGQYLTLILDLSVKLRNRMGSILYRTVSLWQKPYQSTKKLRRLHCLVPFSKGICLWLYARGCFVWIQRIKIKYWRWDSCSHLWHWKPSQVSILCASSNWSGSCKCLQVFFVYFLFLSLIFNLTKPMEDMYFVKHGC